MKLVKEFTLFLEAAVPTPIGQGPFGNRIVHEIANGTVTGERISGKLLGASDWSLVGEDGFLRIDARGQIETDDGACLYIQYQGLLELSDTLREALDKGEGTDFGDQYCVINMRIEAGDERYKWVNTTLFVGQGRSLSDRGVEYCIYRPE